MRKRITALALALTMVLGTVAAAAGTEKSITVTPMTLTVNGQAVTPTKSNGAEAEVFAYDGAAYVPLRYLSELLGGIVEWDKAEPGVVKLAGKTAGRLAPGAYEGSAAGMHGTMRVRVIVKDSEIQDIEVLENNDTLVISETAVEVMRQRVLENQSIAVDTTTGATISSHAYLNAVKEALKQATDDMDAVSVPHRVETRPELPEEEVDVVVVGAGASGMTAALTAATEDLTYTGSGLKVMVVERNTYAGGGSLTSGGTQSLTGGSRLNKTAGVDKTGEEVYTALAKVYDMSTLKNFQKDLFINLMSVSGSTMDRMLDRGAPYRELTSYSSIYKQDGTEAFGRVHLPAAPYGEFKGAPGSGFTNFLRRELAIQKVDVRVDTRVDKLLIENGEVKGVHVTGYDGNYNIRAKRVILATGGAGRNVELLKEYAPTFENYQMISGAGSMGDGLLLAKEAGAAVVNGGKSGGVQGYLLPSFLLGYDYYIPVTAPLVNRDGERFFQEMGAIDYTNILAVSRQPDGMAYGVMDSTNPNASKVEALIETGYAWKADTLEELAGKIDMNKEAFLTTIGQYNADYAAGKDDSQFGTPHDQMEPVTEGPFYAYEVHPVLYTTMFGPKVDGTGRVLREDGSAIGSLYACGELIQGNMFYYAEGEDGTYFSPINMLSGATYTGRLVGEAVQKSLRK